MADKDDQSYKQTRRKQRDAEKQEKQEIDDAVRLLLQHRHGRRYLCWLLEIGKVGSVPFTGNALSSAFEAGQLNVGQQIWSHIMEVNPEALFTTLKEMSDEHGERTGPEQTD